VVKVSIRFHFGRCRTSIATRGKVSFGEWLDAFLAHDAFVRTNHRAVAIIYD